MKTIIHCTLTDEQRKTAAKRLFGRAAPIKRAEISEYVEGCIAQLVSSPQQTAGAPALSSSSIGRLDVIDPEDQDVLAGKSQGYIRGWNMAKQRAK